jgi:hypothetical protein
MSAWIVSKAHIDALVSAAMAQGDTFYWYDADGNHSHELTYTDTERANQVGRMLWAENLASINALYVDTVENPGNCPGPVSFNGPETVEVYKFVRTHKLTPVQILKAIDCYEYQSCEHAGWKTSEAHQFCEALEVRMVSSLPGYNEARWGLDEDDVRGKREVLINS